MQFPNQWVGMQNFCILQIFQRNLISLNSMQIIMTAFNTTITKKPSRENKRWIFKWAIFAFPLKGELLWIWKLFTTEIASLLSLYNEWLFMNTCTLIFSDYHDFIIYIRYLFQRSLWSHFRLLRFLNLLWLCYLAIYSCCIAGPLIQVKRGRFLTHWSLET